MHIADVSKRRGANHPRQITTQSLKWVENHSVILLGVLVSLSQAANLAVLATWGPKFGGDSPRYVDAAARIVGHVDLIGKESSYLGYTLFLVFLSHLHCGMTGVASVQIVVAMPVGLALYGLGNHLGGRLAGLLSAFVYLLNPDICRWNVFILTDALYIDLVIIACWSVWKSSKCAWFRIPSFILILFTAAVRPEGWLLPVVALCYWILHGNRQRVTKYLIITIVVLISVYAFNRMHFFRAAIAHENPVSALDDQVIVWGYPRTRPVPHGAPPSFHLGDLGMQAFRNPIVSTKVAILRVSTEFAHVRPFYSTRHNLAILLCLPAMYSFAIYGLWRLRSEPLVRLISSIVAYHTLIIALFFADWDGRFLLHFLPLIGVLAGAGTTLLLRDHGKLYIRVTGQKREQKET